MLIDDKKKSGKPISEDAQRQMYTKFFKDFFNLNTKRQRDFDKKLAEDLVDKYASQFDEHKLNNNLVFVPKPPLYINGNGNSNQKTAFTLEC
jgi:hypothetical protein